MSPQTQQWALQPRESTSAGRAAEAPLALEGLQLMPCLLAASSSVSPGQGA